MAVLPPDPLFCLKGDMECVHSLCFLNNSTGQTNTLLASTEKGFVYFWNTDTNRLFTKEKLGESIQCIHSKDTDLIIQEKVGNVKLFRYNESNYENIYESSWSGGFCKSVLLGNKLYITQELGIITVIDIKTWEVIQRLNPNIEESNKLGAIMCLEAVQINEKPHLLASYESGDLVLWCCQTGRILNSAKISDCITAMTFDSVTSRGICGCPTNILHVFQINKQCVISVKCTITVPTANGCSVVKLRPNDRKIVVVGGWDGKIRVFSWKSLRQLATLDEHKRASISDVQFCGRIFAASGGAPDGCISLWSLYN